MMGHRVSIIRRPSSFLLIPVGSAGRDLRCVPSMIDSLEVKVFYPA
jgi:hypothetical protein